MAGASRAFQRAFRAGQPDRGEGYGPGSTVVIQGAGAIGALLTVLARHSGAGHITVIGEGAARREVCLALGADLAIGLDGSAEERAEAVAGASPHGLGADVVIEASGAPEALGEAIGLARIEGAVVEFGAYTSRGSSTVEASTICRKDLTVLGSHGYGPGQFGLALRLLERWRGTARLEGLVTHTFPLDRLAEALSATRSGAAMKATVVP
jgi:L-iditol 2-dehydrogenase